jgi:hypothetical protein
MSFRKLYLYPSSGEGGEETPIQLHLRTETDRVSETSCFYSQEHRTVVKIQNPSNSVCYTPIVRIPSKSARLTLVISKSWAGRRRYIQFSY